MICDICDNVMHGVKRPFTIIHDGISYETEALIYRCEFCGAEKLGTCQLQIWEDNIPQNAEGKENPYQSRSRWRVMKEHVTNILSALIQEPDDDMPNEAVIGNTVEGLDAQEIILEETQETAMDEKTEEPMQECAGDMPEESVELQGHEKKRFQPKTGQRPDAHADNYNEGNPDEEKNLGAEDADENAVHKNWNPDIASEETVDGEPVGIEDLLYPQEGKQFQEISDGMEPDAEESTGEEQEKKEEYTGEYLEEYGETEDRMEHGNPRPSMFSRSGLAFQVSDEWLDYMLAKHPWFQNVYEKHVPKRRKQERYLKNHVPSLTAIYGDVLYDTENSTLFLEEERDTQHYGLVKAFYYMTKNGNFFRIMCMYGEPDEFSILEKRDVKKLLAEKTDIYRSVISDEIKE